MASIVKRFSKTTNTVKFRVFIRIKNHPTVTATFQKKSDAKRFASETESRIHNHNNINNFKQQMKLAELIKIYIGKNHDLLKINKNRIRHLDFFKKNLGHLKLNEIKPAMVVELRDELSKIKKNATVNSYLSSLSAVLNYAVKQLCILDINIMSAVQYMKVDQTVRFLNNDELDRLLRACKKSKNKYLYIVVMIALSTGARKQEIMSLTYDQIDFKSNKITLFKTKNKEIRTLHITKEVKKLLLDLKDKNEKSINSNLLFPSQRDMNKQITLEHPWRQALKTAKIENFRFHDLRHTTASYLAMNHASVSEIADVLGHKTYELVKRYAHLSDCHTASVIDKMSERFLSKQSHDHDHNHDHDNNKTHSYLK